jgi:diguanylate cyclase (GGDEF)-like protein
MALAPRFNRRVVTVGFVIIGTILICSTVVADPSGFLRSPVQTITAAALLVGVGVFSVALSSSDLRQREEAVIDPLTGLLNRQALAHRFADLREYAELGDLPVALVLCDVDKFKSVNDEYGHDRGDVVLRGMGQRLMATLRPGELLYRLGGEEFVVVLPGLGLSEAVAVAERLRRAVEAEPVDGLAVTVSLGAACEAGTDLDVELLFKRADRALYDAKRLGRNRSIADDCQDATGPRSPSATPTQAPSSTAALRAGEPAVTQVL